MRIAAVHAADAARAHEADANGAAYGERPADRRRADRALRDADGEVPRAGFARARVETFQLPGGEPDADLAVEDADRRRYCAPFAYAPFGLGTCLAPFHVVAPDHVESGRAPLDDARLSDLAELVPLLAVPEDQVRSQRVEPLAEARGSVRTDPRPRRQVDAEACAVRTRQLGRTFGRGVDRRGEQCVAGDVETVAREPRGVEIVRLEQRRRPAIGGHGALAAGCNQGDDHTTSTLRRADDVDSARDQVARQPQARRILAAAHDAARLPTESGDPCRHVGGLPTRARARVRVRVRSRGKRLAQADDYVEQEVSEGHDEHGATIVPWTASRGAAVSAPSSSAGSWGRLRHWPRRGAAAGATSLVARRRASRRSRGRRATTRPSSGGASS